MSDFDQIAKEANAIFRVAYAPNAMPRKIMEAERPNTSTDWNDGEDARRAEMSLRPLLDSYDKAVKIMTEKQEQ